MRWTEEQLKKFMGDVKKNLRGPPEDEPESVLQSRIVEWATAHGYPFHSHPKSKGYYKAHTKGADWADVTLCMPGRVIFFECKTKKGAIKEGQTALALILMHLKIEYYVVRTFKQVLEIVEGEP